MQNTHSTAHPDAFRSQMPKATEESTPVSNFLGPLLAQHNGVLKDAGYDDVSDFHNIKDAELNALVDRMLANTCPDGRRL